MEYVKLTDEGKLVSVKSAGGHAGNAKVRVIWGNDSGMLLENLISDLELKASVKIKIKNK